MSPSSVEVSAVQGLTRRSVPKLMLQVMAALVPGTLLLTWTLGAGVLINVLACMLVAWLCEAVAVRARGRPIRRALGDGSITLAAWLLALALPPWLPVWQLAIGTLAMVWLGKHLYGGIGHNPFNPAMTGYAVLLVSFPVTMTTWPDINAASLPDFSTLWTIKGLPGQLGSATMPLNWDAMSGATPLDHQRSLERTGAYGTLPGSSMNTLILTGGFVTANLAFLTGGLYLLWRRVISWHIPVAVLGSLATLLLLQSWLAAEAQPALWLSLLSGAAVLGAFFIATDPVSAATSNTGRLLYGTGIGVLTFVIRELGGYPEGVGFAVLIMNCTVPAIDYRATSRR